jgi:phosphoribosylamine--glycine ligase
MEKKRILVVGNGAREHAIIWKLRQSPRLDQVYCTPGNAGIARDALTFDADFGEDFSKLVQRAINHKIDFVVIGPEAPLAEGMADAFLAAGVKVFGPTKEAAQLEASKTFAKDFMKAAGIPTGDYRTFTEAEAAIKYADKLGLPVVIKADGLAAGKGVVVAQTREEAVQAIKDNLENHQFGKASSHVVVEEFLRGEEVSILVLCDGNIYIPMATAQDHKALYENDLGPNTGGMGAYSPAPLVDDRTMREIQDRILAPMHAQLQKQGIDYKGVIFAGLMITADGPKVLEFNCRFGDPETEAVLPRMKNDMVDIIEAVCDGTLHKHHLEWTDEAAVCVVMASRGYPASSEKGQPISGIDDVNRDERAVVFHAATAQQGNDVVTNGGRVLAITALGRDIPRAIDAVYKEVDRIDFDGAQFRRDIGQKALARL